MYVRLRLEDESHLAFILSLHGNVAARSNEPTINITSSQQCWGYTCHTLRLLHKEGNKFMDIDKSALSALLKQTPAAIAVFDREMRYLLVTDAWCSMYAKDSVEMIGKGHYEVFPETPEPLREVHRRGLGGEEVTGKDERFVWLDGTVQYVDWQVSPWFLDTGEIGGLVLVTEDVTSRVKTDNKLAKLTGQAKRKDLNLKRQLLMLSSMGRMASIGYWSLDLDKNHLEWSDQTRLITEVASDYKPSLETGLAFYEAGESRDKITAAIQHCIDSGDGWDLELRFNTAKNRKIWVRTQGEGEFNNGKCVRLFGVIQDVSRQHETRDREEIERKRFELVLDSSGFGLWDWNPQTGNVVFDARWCLMLGYELDEIEPNVESWSSRVHPDDIEACFADIQAHIEGKTPLYSNVHRMRHKDGSWIYIQDRGQVVSRNENGDPIRFIGTHEDVTARERAHLQRQQLYAMTAHELRTPLAALDMMAATEDPDEWWNYKPLFQSTLHETFNTLDDMRMLINPNLQRPIRIESINLPRFNRSLITLTTGIVTSNRFKFELEEDLPSDLRDGLYRLDAYRIRASLVNLIKNACLHSQGSWVKVRCFTEAQEARSPLICWTVQDNGIGIDEQTLLRLFTPFERGNSQAEGMGMGLHIARSWIEELGGTLVYQPCPQGSMFRLALPLNMAKNQASVESISETNQGLTGLRVLFVEDDVTLNMLGQKILEGLGVEIVSARDGEEALQLLDENFDLVLTDYYMPRMDGRELILKARQRGYKGFMVMLTAASLQSDHVALTAAGADLILIKPLTKKMFIDAVHSFNLSKLNE